MKTKTTKRVLTLVVMLAVMLGLMSIGIISASADGGETLNFTLSGYEIGADMESATVEEADGEEKVNLDQLFFFDSLADAQNDEDGDLSLTGSFKSGVTYYVGINFNPVSGDVSDFTEYNLTGATFMEVKDDVFGGWYYAIFELPQLIAPTYQLILPENVTARVSGSSTPITEAKAGDKVLLWHDCPEDKGFRKIEASSGVELTLSEDYWYFIMPEEDVTITVTYASPITEAAFTTTGFKDGLELSDVQINIPEDAPFELLDWILFDWDGESTEGEIASGTTYYCAVVLAPKDGYGFSLNYCVSDELLGFYPDFTLDGISPRHCSPATAMDFNKEGAIALHFCRFAPSSETVEQTNTVLENYSNGKEVGDLTITFDPVFDGLTKDYWITDVWGELDPFNALSNSDELELHTQYYLCVVIESDPFSEVDILGMAWDALLVNGLSPMYTMTNSYSGGSDIVFIYELPELHWYVENYDENNHWLECSYGECDDVIEVEAHSFSEEYISDGNTHWHECECGAKADEDSCNASSEYDWDDDYHWYPCETCGYKHDEWLHGDDGSGWQDGDGYHWQNCSCGYKLYYADHGFSDWQDDGTEHYKYCMECSLEIGRGTHDYQAGYDDNQHYTRCTVCECDEPSTYPEYHTITWHVEGEYHWQECDDGCGYKSEQAKHNFRYYYEDYTDENTHWQKCECGEMTAPENHNYGEYITDGINHFRECVCGKRVDESSCSASGDFEADGEYHWRICDTCGGEVDKEIHNEDGEGLRSDADKHWKVCVACEKAYDVTSHDIDAQMWQEDDSTGEHYKECPECGFEKYRAEHEFTANYDASAHYEECTCGKVQNYDSHTFTTWIPTESGTHYRECSDCEYVSEESNHADSDGDKKCDVCGYSSFKITANLPENVTIVPVNGSKPFVEAGGSFSFTVEIAEGYVKNDDFEVRVNGVYLEDVRGVYTIEDITDDQVIEVDADGIVKSDTYVSGVLMQPGDYLAVGASATTKEKPAGGYAYLSSYGTLVLHNYSTSAGYEMMGGLVSIYSTDPNMSIYLEGENSLTPAGEMTGGILAMGRMYLHGDSDSSLTINTDSFAIQSISDMYFWGGVYRFNSGIGSGGCIDIDSDSDISISTPVLGITAEDVYIYAGSLKITDCQTAIRANSIAVYSGYVDICSVATGADDDTYYAVSVEPYIKSILRVMASTSADGELGVYDPAEYKSYDRIVIISPGAVVGGVPLFDGEYVAVGSSTATLTKPEGVGYAHYSEGVLTLNNYSYTGAGYEYDWYAVVYTIGDVEIVLVGTTTLTQTEVYSEAILGDGSIIISGDGKLVCDAEYAINCWGELTVNGGEITINNTFAGLLAEHVIINGGNITVKTIESYSGEATIMGIGVDESIDINGGSITINSINYGMSAEGDITISGGTVVIVAETGIDAYDVIIKGGNITIDADRFAIRAMNTMLFKGGVLDARSNNVAADGDYWAISVAPVLDGTGITIQASADRNGGLGAYDPLTIQTYDYIMITGTPEEPTPEEPTPEEPTPEESTPEEPTPEESTPEESTPEESTPEESTPEVTTPEESTPEESTPEETQPEQPTEEPQEEPQEEPKGLSGGAIAGIVVGSTVVLGAGGFSIFWFVIQKRDMAELIEKMKKLFSKK